MADARLENQVKACLERSSELSENKMKLFQFKNGVDKRRRIICGFVIQEGPTKSDSIKEKDFCVAL